MWELPGQAGQPWAMCGDAPGPYALSWLYLMLPKGAGKSPAASQAFFPANYRSVRLVTMQPGGQYVASHFWKTSKGLDWLPASAAARKLCWCVEYLAGGIPHSKNTNALARSPSIYQNQRSRSAHAGAPARTTQLEEAQPPAPVDGQPWEVLVCGEVNPARWFLERLTHFR